MPTDERLRTALRVPPAEPLFTLIASGECRRGYSLARLDALAGKHGLDPVWP